VECVIGFLVVLVGCMIQYGTGLKEIKASVEEVSANLDGLLFRPDFNHFNTRQRGFAKIVQKSRDMKKTGQEDSLETKS